jgi:hypothetical protein
MFVRLWREGGALGRGGSSISWKEVCFGFGDLLSGNSFVN